MKFLIPLIIGGIILFFVLPKITKVSASSESIENKTASSESIENKQVTFYLPQKQTPEPPQRLTRQQLLTGSFNFDNFRTILR